MNRTYGIVLALGIALALPSMDRHLADACCPAPSLGKPVVNADQFVIIIWDAATQTEHFIRRASFKSVGNDFGFLIPSPSKPELAESGNEAFPALQQLTEPEIITKKRPSGSGCSCGEERKASALAMKAAAPQVRVLEEKMVAGFHAKVLEADTTDVLVQWLKENGYAYSPEVAAWAKPYVEQKWKLTALKVAKKKDDVQSKDVTASALRMSFKTDRPLFPYREPDSTKSAASLEATHRLLRIYFLADARYQGEMTKEPRTRDEVWTGKVAWAGKLSGEDRTKTLEHLRLPNTTGPAEWYLTEFEDNWPYKVAPADVYFTRSTNQMDLRREPIVRYVGAKAAPDLMPFALVLAMGTMFGVARLRGRRG